MSNGSPIPSAEALLIDSLLAPTPGGIASRVLARASGGNLTLFAFDAGESLAEHAAPFDALVLVLEGVVQLTIGGVAVRAVPGTLVRMPAGVPHSVEAVERVRMLLFMLRDRADTDRLAV